MMGRWFVLGATQDITEQLMASELLHESEQRLKSVGRGEKVYHFGGTAACWAPAFKSEPFPLDWKAFSERTGAVKGAPQLGAAKRTLDGEDRSGMMAGEGKRENGRRRWAP